MFPDLQHGAIMPSDLSNTAVSGALTVRQESVLVVIAEYHRVTGEACPANYIARRLRLHHSTVQDHLVALHRKGWLRAPNSPSVPSRWLR